MPITAAAPSAGFGCACCNGLNWTARVADGVPDVIKAVRDELRKGADHIKLMVSGGVASQADPLESLQYRIDEIEAAVEEATRWGSYVCAHAYSAKAIERAVTRRRALHRARQPDRRADREADGRSRRLCRADAGCLRLAEEARPAIRAFGVQPGEERPRAGSRRLRSLEIFRSAGVKIGFGSDLLGQLQTDHCTEFTIRAEAMRPQDIIRSATLVNAEIVRAEGKLGELIPGAYADLLVVDGDPYRDIGVFRSDGSSLSAIMSRGRFVKHAM